jgi:hypothetical protein
MVKKIILAYAIPFEDSVDIYGNEEIRTCTCGDYFYVVVNSDLRNEEINVKHLLRCSSRYKDYNLGLYRLSKHLRSDGSCRGCNSSITSSNAPVQKYEDYTPLIEEDDDFTPLIEKDDDYTRSCSSDSDIDADDNDDNDISVNSSECEGDSLPYPHKTVEELDAELDEIRKSNEKAIELDSWEIRKYNQIADELDSWLSLRDLANCPNCA